MIYWLTIFALLVLVLIIFRRRITSKYLKFRKNEDKINKENILKHVFHSNNDNIDCSINSIAGNLEISRDYTSKLVTDLNERLLIEIDNGLLKLSKEGRQSALKIIRIHRILETYLAENTGLKDTEWHSIAEKKEHNYSEYEIEKIAAQIGNPLFDPHGDPIPTRDGEIFELEGVSILRLEENESARIIHIEDEPEIVFSQLSALGLYKGVQIRVQSKDQKKIVFEANGEVCTLAKLLAENITVSKIEPHEIIDDFRILSDLDTDESAEVISLSGSLRGLQRRRLMDFGIVPGTMIKKIIQSPSGDPSMYEIRGTLVAIRKIQTDMIFIRSAEKEKNDAA